MNRFVCLICVFLVAFPADMVAFPASMKRKFQVAYYELPPYIYRDDKGYISGIIPEIHEQLSKWCNIKFSYDLKMKSANDFTNFMENATEMGRINMKGIIWLSLTQHTQPEIMTKYKFDSNKIIRSSINILVHRAQIGIFAKIKVGIFECRYLVLIGFILSIIFGMLIWAIERWQNIAF